MIIYFCMKSDLAYVLGKYVFVLVCIELLVSSGGGANVIEWIIIQLQLV